MYIFLFWKLWKLSLGRAFIRECVTTHHDENKSGKIWFTKTFAAVVALLDTHASQNLQMEKLATRESETRERERAKQRGSSRLFPQFYLCNGFAKVECDFRICVNYFMLKIKMTLLLLLSGELTRKTTSKIYRLIWQKD